MSSRRFFAQVLNKVWIKTFQELVGGSYTQPLAGIIPISTRLEIVPKASKGARGDFLVMSDSLNELNQLHEGRPASGHPPEGKTNPADLRSIVTALRTTQRSTPATQAASPVRPRFHEANRPAQSPASLDSLDGSSVQHCWLLLQSIAKDIGRIADSLSPPPAKIVDSVYVAEQLGCTTTWVAAQARSGTIPPSCIVPGAGKGKLWKFYRTQIDAWISAR